jgi:hypothetical protein
MESQLGDDLRQLASGRPFTPDIETIRVRARQRHRRDVLGKAGIGAGIGAVAAGVAVALVATSVPQPGAPVASAAKSSAAGSKAGAAGAKSVAVNPTLVSLAAYIKAAGNGSLPGNASLVIRTQTDPGVPPQVSYNLYVDTGAFYGGGNKSSLMEAVAQHQNLADGINAREVAAARYAVTGDLTTAERQMINASPNDLGLGLSAAAREKIWKKAMAEAAPIFQQKGIKAPSSPPVGKALEEQTDNYLWNNSVDALSAGAGNPEIREGVLRLLSIIPGVAVANSTTGGQPTLTLTAGSTVFGAGSEQVLTVNAQTGMPVTSVMNIQGLGPSKDTYQVSRVTMANIEAGKF